MKEAEKHQRDTKQRRIVYEAVKKRLDHPTADDIYFDIHAENPKISKATVYRNLKLLADSGEIMRVVVLGADRFDITTKKHYHAICTVCGKVIDAPLEYIDDYDAHVAEETGFLIKRHRAVFEGICPDCRKS